MFSRVTDDFEYLCLQLASLGCFKGPPVLEVRSPIEGQAFALFPAPQIVHSALQRKETKINSLWKNLKLRFWDEAQEELKG